MKDLYVNRLRKKAAWTKTSIRPGVVGSVGDTLSSVRLKQTSPDSKPRYMNMGRGKRKYGYGSSISDGYVKSKTSKGRGADVYVRIPEEKEFMGYFHQDIVPVDRSSMTQMLNQGNFGWRSQVASAVRAKFTGDSFLPLPGGYGPRAGEVHRGSQRPAIAVKSAGTGYPAPATNPRNDFKVVERDYDDLLDQPHTFLGRTATKNLNRSFERRFISG